VAWRARLRACNSTNSIAPHVTETNLKGSGPAPPPFKDRMPDLTTLAKRHGGQFPDAYVRDALRNGVEISAHGPAEMPIWGTRFKEHESLTHAQLTARMANLVAYLKSQQAK
jgi:hypothetical protein